MSGDKFRWIAYDLQASPYHQINPSNGQRTAYENLPLDQLSSFELWDWARNERVLLVKFKPGERLVWRRRTEMAPGSVVTEVCHIVGKIGRDGQKGILGIFESDGRIEAVGEFLPTSNWFYPPSSEQQEEQDNDAQVS